MAGAGCVVTDKIMFPADQNFPPDILEGSNSYSLGSIIWVDKSASPSDLKMNVLVRDDNVLQPLEAQWRLVTVGDDTPPVHPGEVSPSGTQDPRDFSFSVPSTLLANGKCYQLELAVSGGFYVPKDSRKAPAFFGVPKGDPNDVDLATWIILEGQPNPSADVAMRLLASCPVNPPMTPSTSTAGQTMGQ
jgi:hypothetical protein